MKILVTGASGYLGGSFIQDFKEKYQFETFSTKKDQMEDLNLNEIEVVLHCAALVHQREAHPYEYYQESNVTYPLALAKKAKDQGVKQFIFISTIAVYGEDLSLIDEESSFAPLSPYGKSKYEAEKELLKLASDTFSISIIRPPMIYGYQAPGNIQSLIKIIKKTPLLPFGGIHNRRSFVYIKNLTALIEKVIEHKQGGSFLACDDHPISTSYLIQSLSNALNKQLYLVKIPFFSKILKKIKPKIYARLYSNLEINNQKTKKDLNFSNPYSFEKGIICSISQDNH